MQTMLEEYQEIYLCGYGVSGIKKKLEEKKIYPFQRELRTGSVLASIGIKLKNFFVQGAFGKSFLGIMGTPVFCPGSSILRNKPLGSSQPQRTKN